MLNVQFSKRSAARFSEENDFNRLNRAADRIED
jgi:hypothetical protein